MEMFLGNLIREMFLFWESISGEFRASKIPHAGKRTHIRINKVVKADAPIGAALAISRIISMAQVVLRSASKLK